MGSSNKDFISTDYWTDAWARHIKDYLSAPPRAGIWLEKVFPNKRLSILESAGGSCRDSYYLFQRGYASLGTDFDGKTIEYLKKTHSKSNFVLKREDAFDFSFSDDSFDIVFHNGFWVLFDDNEVIKKSLLEQARVSRKFLVIIAHNHENFRNRMVFEQKSKLDDLYNIRFFHRRELIEIIQSSGLKYKKIRCKKFGSSADQLYRLEKKFAFFGPLARFIVPMLYPFSKWSDIERVALIVELDKGRQE